MKNHKQGFVVPLIIVIIAVLAIGGGIYVFEQSKPQQTTLTVQNSTSTDTGQVYNGKESSGTTQSPDDSKTYQLKSNIGTVTFQYPNGFNVTGATGLDGGGFQIEVKNFD